MKFEIDIFKIVSVVIMIFLILFCFGLKEQIEILEYEKIDKMKYENERDERDEKTKEIIKALNEKKDKGSYFQ